MITFYKKDSNTYFAVESKRALNAEETARMTWALAAEPLKARRLDRTFIGPRREMITPWSTNAVEIAQNMGIDVITRIERLTAIANGEEPVFDKMLERVYEVADQQMLSVDKTPDPICHIEDLESYNVEEGLALSPEEIAYLQGLQKKLGRPLTDSEVFGFSQVNSEHCRHKIFNGTFIIDDQEKPDSLFQLIKRTSKVNPNGLVSAYKDNVAFVKGPMVDQFAPVNPSKPDYFEVSPLRTVISLKAETHNFPTTVEPFNGAATGTGGEIRDRLGGGRASLPIAGTAVYMTSYPRLTPDQRWEMISNPRVWLYQTPAEILIKASNGASDFGNKFGQPLICGSLLTFEHDENGRMYAYDKVIMLAGGVGFAAARDARKGTVAPDEKVIVMGGDNYRIGMGGGAVSSVETGQYANAIELNAVQRANPEMQKRVANVIRALAESKSNPIVSIHDHGAGGHLNALSELVEETGGEIDMSALPVGDPTLSAKEIVGNESQERMGMVIREKDIAEVREIAARERAPFYVVGHTTGDHKFVFKQSDGVCPIDLEMSDMFGKAPKTIMKDKTVSRSYSDPDLSGLSLGQLAKDIMGLEAVACKDWLTNKVDRSVTGRVARQQCQGVLQLPLSDCGMVALDYTGRHGIATSIGHAPQAALADSAAGSILAVAESLTNIVGAPLAKGLKSVSLSANWMWPCKNEGEDAALYRAVASCSDFVCRLGINIPTGKDSLSMTQKYGDDKVYAPGTVIISAAGETGDVRKAVSPVVANKKNTRLIYVDFSSAALAMGGSALYQSMGRIGSHVPTVSDVERFKSTFDAIQRLVRRRSILAMHDVSAGGLLTTLLEMTFANTKGGLKINLDGFKDFGEKDIVKMLFAENPAVVIQVNAASEKSICDVLSQADARYFTLGQPIAERVVDVTLGDINEKFDIMELRNAWYRPSFLLDCLQSGTKCATMRFENYGKQPLRIRIPSTFDGSLKSRDLTLGARKPSGVKAAIIREKGVNGDREMAYSLYLAGFDVKDVHMTDLMSGRETLDDINMIVFCGGFSNSDVMGSAKGWASGFKWNDTARKTLERYYSRPDTLSLGICNGCQLMIELGLINPEHEKKTVMDHNISHKFESTFLGVKIPANNSVMFSSLEGMTLGIWVAHGEGKFNMPLAENAYNIVARYDYLSYPGNPNGSRGGVAALASADGRHLAMMPHLERAIFPWQCGVYPEARRKDDVTPWIDAFINARKWVEKHK